MKIPSDRPSPLLLSAAVLTLSVSWLPANVIITEVADGTLTGQQPKFVEITNVGTAAYTFPEGAGIIVQTNANTDYEVDWDLSGATLQPGQSWVVNSLTPSGAEAATFLSLFGKDADQYADVAFGNGDDRYILTDGTSFLDIYGEDGVDASPSGGEVAAWGYADGYAYRKAGITAGKGLAFDPSEWVFGGDGSLAAASEAEQIALAQAVLTPGSYGPATPNWAGFPLDETGNADTGGFLGWVNVTYAPWVWSFSLSGWLYLPESLVSPSGAWTYVPKN